VTSKKNDKDTFEVYCPRCGEGLGLVTKTYAEKRRNESRGELIQVKKNLGWFEPDKRSEEQLLKELGFE
jgi:hypothetical protein